MQIYVLGKFFMLAAIVDIILIALVYLFTKNFNISILFLGLCVFICASVRGIIFPLVHHVGTAQSKTGAQISNVYFSNVFGSALAPILISFIALDYLNTQQVYLLICFFYDYYWDFLFKFRKIKICRHFFSCYYTVIYVHSRENIL